MLNWIKNRLGLEADIEPTASPPPKRAAKARPRVAANQQGQRPPGDIARKKFVREETGTHETLKIVDDSLELEQDQGLDPYNTGGFDRSRNWDTRFRK